MNTDQLDDLKQGTILHNSWGYDCTINDFCVVLENTGKTLKCQVIGKKTVNKFIGGENVIPDRSVSGGVFRIRISKDRHDPSRCWLIGSYPFCNGRAYKLRGCWYDHEEGHVYTETER